MSEVIMIKTVPSNLEECSLYNLNEIDRMRGYLVHIITWEFGLTLLESITGPAAVQIVEERLRTCILAGITPDQLAEKAEAARFKMQEEEELSKTARVAHKPFASVPSPLFKWFFG